MIAVREQGSLFTQIEVDPNWRPPVLPDLSRVNCLALDCETTGLDPFKDKPVGIGLGWRTEALRSIYLPFGHSTGNIDFDLVKRFLATELFGKEVVFANAKFDIAMLRNVGIDLEAIGVKPRDIAFNGALLDDNRRAGFGLDELALKYVGAGKTEVKGGLKCLDQIPSWFVDEYCQNDCRLTLGVFENTLPMLHEQNLLRVLELENDLIYCVCEIERNGARLHVAKLEQWRDEITALYESAVLEIYKRYHVRVNPNSAEDLHRLFKNLHIKSPGYQGKKGLAGFTDERLSAIDHPVISLILFARRADSMLSKFFDKYHEGLDGDVLRFQLHQLKGDEDFGTVSGRFSSSGGGKTADGYSFNVQQVIKSSKQKEELGDRWIIRELFIPDDGYKFFSSDASQIEYRLVAHYANNPKVLAAYENNPDADYHKVVLDLLRPMMPSWQGKSDKEVRRPVKNVNFARLYGGGPPKISYMLGLDGSTSIPQLKPEEYETCLPETMAFLRVYDQLLPEAKDLMNITIRLARTRGWVKTMLGRRARFTPEDRHYSALNRVVQGTAADYMKLTMRDLYRERKTLGIHKLRQMVHDEQCGDIDPDPLCHLRLAEFFNEQRMNLRVPILWDTKVGNTWAEC